MIFLCPYKEKGYPFTGFNYLWLISDFCQKMWFFHIGHNEQVNDFIKPGSFVAVAAPRSSKDTVWFIHVLETNLVSTKVSKNISSNYAKRNQI